MLKLKIDVNLPQLLLYCGFSRLKMANVSDLLDLRWLLLHVVRGVSLYFEHTNRHAACMDYLWETIPFDAHIPYVSGEHPLFNHQLEHVNTLISSRTSRRPVEKGCLICGHNLQVARHMHEIFFCSWPYWPSNLLRIGTTVNVQKTLYKSLLALHDSRNYSSPLVPLYFLS